jgi:hypothetical protein
MLARGFDGAFPAPEAKDPVRWLPAMLLPAAAVAVSATAVLVT